MMNDSKIKILQSKLNTYICKNKKKKKENKTEIKNKKKKKNTKKKQAVLLVSVVVGNDNRTQTPKQPQSTTYLPNIFTFSNGPL